MEIIGTGRTVEEAVQNACTTHGIDRENDIFEIDIIDLPKRTLFGLRVIPAKVRLTLPDAPAVAPKEPEPKKEPTAHQAVASPSREAGKGEGQRPPRTRLQRENQNREPKRDHKPQRPQKQPARENPSEGKIEEKKPVAAAAPTTPRMQEAVDYLSDILHGIGLDGFTVSVEETEENAVISFEGDGLGVIIGRRGETLDALQYLAGLVVNKDRENYYRVMVDSAGYRKKREKTLRELAKKISNSVLKTGRQVTLEPMNPYERRIIHSAVSAVEGVTSRSTGEEPYRRVTILSLNPKPQNARSKQGARGGNRPTGGRGGNRRGPRREDRREERKEPSNHTRPAETITPVDSDAEMFEKYLANHPQPERKSTPAKPQEKPQPKSVDAAAEEMPLYGKIEL